MGAVFFLLSGMSANLLKRVDGYTVTTCAGAECCQCPQPAQHWAAYHAKALASTHQTRWPDPYCNRGDEEGCAVPVVPTCASGPVLYTSRDMQVRPASASTEEDAYHHLAREYAAALLNTAPRPARPHCSDYATLVDTVAPIDLEKGAAAAVQVRFKADVMDRAAVLLAVHCDARSFGALTTPSERQEVQWLTSLLHGFNTGTLFAGQTACAIGGDPARAYGSDWIGGDVACVSSRCTLDAGAWFDLACASHANLPPPRGDTTQCPRWPPGTSEDAFVCGENETFSQLLHDGAHRDLWSALGREYVAASLNVAAGACATGTVANAISEAREALESRCPCSDARLRGQPGCRHAPDEAHSRDRFSGLFTILSEYNQGIRGPGSCLEGLGSAQPVAETAIESAASFCCSTGCTRGYAYYLGHSCHSWHLNGQHREAWPGGDSTVYDDTCVTLPNFEDAKTLCGRTNYEILSSYTREQGVDEQDSWTMLAQTLVVAQLNENAGACTRTALTRYASPSEPWRRLSVAETIEYAQSLLQTHCDMAGRVEYSSALGRELHAVRTVLDDFVRGAYGPGRCAPDASPMDGCSNVRLDSSLAAMPKVVNERGEAECYLDADVPCCTLTANYWLHHNIEQDPPRNAAPWPALVTSATCDYVQDACTATDADADDAMARAMAQVLRINPVRLAPSVGGVQEHASYCSSNISGTLRAPRRPDVTRMINLLRLSRLDARFTQGQRQWIRLANAFSVAMLNARHMANGRCRDSPAAILSHILARETSDTAFLAHTDYLQQCLFGACDAAASNPAEAMPSLPDGRGLCGQGFFSVVNALEAFSNGKTSATHSADKHGHCSRTEPPSERCVIGNKDRFCECVRDRLYFQSDTQTPWPRVSTSNLEVAVPFPAEILDNANTHIPPTTQEFTALACPTGAAAPVTWLDLVLEERDRPEDAYSVLMSQLIPAWLNVFAGACPPSDVADTLVQVSHLVDSMVHSPDRTLCVSETLGTRVPVSPTSASGVVMMSAARVLASFNEGYQGSASCQDLCVGVDAPDCGDHGTCQPETGTCACEDGYTGAKCLYSECSGHGIHLVPTAPCDCFTGWGGPTCSTCAGPRTARGHVFLCMPCSEDVCGAPGEFLLRHVRASNATALLKGDTRLPGYKDLPLPVRPGTSGLDCACNPETETARAPKPSSHRERIAADFERERGTRQSSRRERSHARNAAVHDINLALARGPRNPEAWTHYGVTAAARTTTVTTRDLCDESQATVEGFLLLCMEDLLELQTVLEENTAMCEASIDVCENAISENTAVSNKDLQEEADDNNDEQRRLSIGTLAVAGATLFMLGVFVVILLFVWAGVRFRNPGKPVYPTRPPMSSMGYENTPSMRVY